MKNLQTNSLHSFFAAIVVFLGSLPGLSAEEKPIQKPLPKDFAFRYATEAVAVIPQREDVIQISRAANNPPKEKAFVLSKSFNGIVSRKPISEGDARDIYHQAVKLGIFELKDEYIPDEVEDGGSVTTVSVTANGKTKKVVIASGITVPEIEKLMKLIQAKIFPKED